MAMVQYHGKWLLVWCGLWLWACQSTNAPKTLTLASQAAEQDANEVWRQQAPVAAPASATIIHLPEVRKALLANGMAIVTTPKPGLPLVHVLLNLQIGVLDEGKEQAGLAALLLSSLEYGGSKRFPKGALHQQLTDIGSNLQFSATANHLRIEATVATEHVGVVLDLLADLVQQASIDADAVAQAKLDLTSELELIKSSPGRSGGRVLYQLMFGQHPLGRSLQGTERSLARLQSKDVVAFYRRHLVPQRAALFLTGDTTPELAYKAAQQIFANWQGKPSAAPLSPTMTEQALSRVAIVERAQAPQTFVAIGHSLQLPPDHADLEALLCVNAVLGGMFQSRINLNLREDKGYTYGARSSLQATPLGSSFVISSSIQTQHTAAAIAEIQQEIDHFLSDGMSSEELNKARDNLVLSLPGHLQGVAEIGTKMAALYEDGLPFTYYEGLASRLAQLTAEQVTKVARHYLQPGRLQYVLVGDGPDLQRQLGQLTLPSSKLLGAEAILSGAFD